MGYYPIECIHWNVPVSQTCVAAMIILFISRILDLIIYGFWLC